MRVFRPEGPVDLPAGTRVEVIVPEEELSAVEVIRKRYPNIIYMPDEDAQEMLEIIEEEFGGGGIDVLG